MVVRHSGRWDKFEYIDGEEQLVYIPREKLSHDTLVEEIHEYMKTSSRDVKYLLNYFTTVSSGRKIKVLLKSDLDFARLVGEQKEHIVYVTKKTILETPMTVSNGDNEDLIGDASDLHYDHEDLSIKEDEDGGKDESEDENEDENYSIELQYRLIAEFCVWIHEPGRKDEFVKTLEHNSHHNLSDNATNVEVGDVDRPCLGNWLIPVAHIGDASVVVQDYLFLSGMGALDVGSTFLKKDDLSNAVGKWHMEHKVEHSVSRSSKTRLEFIYKHKDQCPFMLRATTVEGMWKVIKFNKTHTSQLDLTRTDPRKVPSKVIAELF